MFRVETYLGLNKLSKSGSANLYRMVTKQSRSAPVMRTVLEAVIERLNDGDESLIRIPEICEATGVNYGSVYHHFGSRDGVIDAAYHQMFTKLAEEDIATLHA